MNTKFKRIITSIILIVMLVNFTSTTCLAVTDENANSSTSTSSEDNVFLAAGLDVVDGLVGVFTILTRIKVLLFSAALQGLATLLGKTDGLTERCKCYN